MSCYCHACVPTTQQIHWLLSADANRKGLVTADYAQVGIRLGTTQGVVKNGVSDLIVIDVISELGSEDTGHRLHLRRLCIYPEDALFPPGARQRTRVYSGEATEHPVKIGGAEGGTKPSFDFDSSIAMGTGPGRGGRRNPRGLSTVYLARYYFPGLCRKFKLGFFDGFDATIDGAVLAHQLNVWKKAGIPLTTIQSMMDEFAKHPDWCKKNAPPWKMFLARRHQLAKLIAGRPERGQASNRDPSAWGRVIVPRTRET